MTWFDRTESPNSADGGVRDAVIVRHNRDVQMVRCRGYDTIGHIGYESATRCDAILTACHSNNILKQA